MSKRNKIKAGLTASLNKLKFIVPKVITDGVNVGTVDVIVKKHAPVFVCVSFYLHLHGDVRLFDVSWFPMFSG